MYFVFIRMQGGVTEGDSSLCCCVPFLLSTRSTPHTESDYDVQIFYHRTKMYFAVLPNFVCSLSS